MNRAADVVVIGGGINGCSTAYALAKRGVRNVVLLEKGHIASGPTGRSSGIVRQHYTHQTLAAMARDSVEIWAHFADEVGGDAGFVNCGVVFMGGERDAEAIRNTVAMQRRIGIDARLLDPGDLAAIEPELRPAGIECGAFEPRGGYADPALATNSYAEAARREGVTILQKTMVTAVSTHAGRIVGVTTTAGDISAPVVINVAGPWGAAIAAMAGVHIPISVSRHPVVILLRPQRWHSPTPAWVNLADGWYFKPERHAALMVGSVRDTDDEVDIENHATVTSYREVEECSAAAMRQFPIMADGEAQGGWAGLYDVTPDWQPVIDRMPDVEGFFSAVGFSGHGFKIAPAVGRAMAELVLDGDCGSYDLSLFRHSRFAEHQSSRGAYGFGIVG